MFYFYMPQKASTASAVIHGFFFLIYILFLVDPLGNADGSRGADQSAEMAAYALGADDTGLAGIGIEGNGLMAAVHA